MCSLQDLTNKFLGYIIYASYSGRPQTDLGLFLDALQRSHFALNIFCTFLQVCTDHVEEIGIASMQSCQGYKNPSTFRVLCKVEGEKHLILGIENRTCTTFSSVTLCMLTFDCD